MTDKQLQNLFGVRDFFVYELDFGAVAAAGTASSSFTVQADSNFLWQYGGFFADIAGAAQTDDTRVLPLMSATILDTSSGRQLMSAATPIPSIFGTGQLPFLLPTPRFFRAQTQVTVNIANFSVGTTYTLKLQFIGTKFFKFAQTL
jgi:hypothetical protein